MSWWTKNRAAVRDAVLRLSRLAAYVAFIALCASVWVGHRARAQVDEMMLGVGAQMMRYVGATHQDAPRPLQLNGARIMMASGTAPDGVEDVLDWFEAKCQERDGQLAEQLAELGEARLGGASPSDLDATLRDDDGDRGYVACLDTGGERLGPWDILERVERYAQSGDVSDVGYLRYVFAERAEHGSHFVAYWTEGPLPVLEMFPEEGDAPGRDPEGIARPPGARRILSAWEEGFPQSMTIWTGGELDVDGLEAFYREQLPGEGWSLVEPEGGLPEVDGSRALVVSRDDYMTTLVLSEDRDGRGVVTVLVSGEPEVDR